MSIFRTYHISFLALLSAALFTMAHIVHAETAITVGTLESDPSTICCLGVSLPIVSGDDNYNAQTQVSFRKQGTTAWSSALPLLRVRPDLLSTDTPRFPVANQFAGSVFDLDPDTNYEVRIVVNDPDGVTGTSTQILTLRTRKNPMSDPLTPKVVNVSNMTAFSAAVAAAKPGDVITLANGTYVGSVTVSTNGTEENPIFIRGKSQAGVVIDASGLDSGIDVSASNVYVENLTITGSDYGIRMPTDASNVVVRFTRLTNVDKGIKAKNYSHRNFYICDNVLEGRVVWPNTSNTTWDKEGIVITGSGHVVCNNTLSGFGDSLGFAFNTDIPTRAIDIYGNDVLWGGDDGMELDEGERNIRAFRNRINNSGSGVSMQPVWGGPVYVFQNILYNTKNAPYKLNNEPSGFYIFHNTAVRAGWAWIQYSNKIYNFQFFNNITVGTEKAIDKGLEISAGGVEMSSVLTLADINYNGWLPEGKYRFSDYTKGFTFSEMQTKPPYYEANGRLLTSSIFEASVPILDEAIPDEETFRNPVDFTLSASSSALNVGRVLPNINDDSIGVPDLGALERGKPVPTYGARSYDTTPPSTPSINTATAVSDSQVNLTWTTASDADSGISGYNIYRNGVKVGTASSTNYSDTGLNEATSYAYQVSAVNGSGLAGTKSTTVNATTLSDVIPPQIESVTSYGYSTKLVIVFSETLDSSTSQSASNYGIDYGISVSNATLESDQKTVTLTITALSEQTDYLLTVNNVTDNSALKNVIASNSQMSFKFTPALLITGTTPETYLWGVLSAGQDVYMDRPFTYTTVPVSLEGQQYLRTANADKISTGSNFLNFTVNQDVTVYVAFDDRITAKPSWLSTWTDTGLKLYTSDADFDLYHMDFPKGIITLGGNEDGGGNSMYTVIVVPKVEGGSGGGGTGGGGTGDGGTGDGGTGDGGTGGGSGDTSGGGGGAFSLFETLLLLMMIFSRRRLGCKS